MKITASLLLLLVSGLALSVVPPGVAQQHHARHLGNPDTRFAPPLKTTNDLRVLFRDPKLRLDMESILRQCNWPGDKEDLFRAALAAPIEDIKLPVGTLMPFMSSRKNGHPIALLEVVWEGREPAPAFAFEFTSKGRRYQCVTPKACSNFFVEDLGAPELTLTCQAPEKVPAKRPAEVRFSLCNTGSVAEPKAVVIVKVPPGAAVVRTSPEATVAGGTISWELPNLETNVVKELAARFLLGEPGTLVAVGAATGDQAKAVTCTCETRVVGLPALLIDAVDAEDPVEVGQDVAYTIKITNQGTAACTNMRLVCTLPENEEYVSGSGPTGVKAQARTVTTEPMAAFAPKSVASWRVVVKAREAGEARLKVNLWADEFEKPIFEEEPTVLY